MWGSGSEHTIAVWSFRVVSSNGWRWREHWRTSLDL
jgi:hypothetical protein